MGNLSGSARQKTHYLKRDICAYCGGTGGTRDHITPRHLKPEHKDNWSNLTGCCDGCNQEKAILPLLTFLWLKTLPQKEYKRERRRLITEIVGIRIPSESPMAQAPTN